MAVETRRTSRLRKLYLSGMAIQATIRSASTILRRVAEYAGTNALRVPISAARTIVRTKIVGEI